MQPPPEVRARNPGRCWKLRRCLYGTRDAPARWEALYIEQLGKLGVKAGLASSCCFFNAELQVRCVVHGDDFTFSGTDSALNAVEKGMKEAFLCKVEGRLGDGPGDLQEIRILNRVVTWCKWGIQYEADPRHAEILMRELEVQSKEHVVTPGVKWKPEDIEQATPLDAEKTARYRPT